MKWVKATKDLPDEYGSVHWRDADTKLPISAGAAYHSINSNRKDLVEWLCASESPSPSIEELAQKLRAANPFIGDIESIEDKRIGWNECIRKLLELSKQQP